MINLTKIRGSLGAIDRHSSPIDVAHVKDLAVGTMNLAVGTHELHGDRCKAQVRCHGEVGNGCDQGNSGGDVVEDTVGARLGERETPKDERRDKHNRGDSLCHCKP